MRRRVSLLAVLVTAAAACGPIVEFDVGELEAVPRQVPEQSVVYDAAGNELAVLRTEFRERVPIEDVPQHLVDAVIAAEDRRFRDHAGVDPRAVVRAALANADAGTVVQGASTITQQLVEQTYDLGADPTSLQGKVREAVMALRIERERGKDEILEDYLNTIYLGNGAHGIEAAAWTYWRTHARNLDLVQSITLAGMIRAPEALDPSEDPDAVRLRRDQVVDAMVEEGLLDGTAAAGVRRQPVVAFGRPASPAVTEPHWVAFVERTLLAADTFGDSLEERARLLYGGGLRIHTTLDPGLQAIARDAAAVFSEPDEPEVAIVTVDPASGAILAAVGGRDFSTQAFDLATQGRRQPGSTFKTFTLATAIAQGISPDTLLDGRQAVLDTPSGPWRVRNADRVSYPAISLTEATVGSVNAAYARLALQLGIDRVVGTARAMGVTSPVNRDPAVALGALDVGVSPLDMASAYATLAAQGERAPAHAIDRVETLDGEVVWRPDRTPRRVLAPDVAHVVTEVLQQVVERGTGRRAALVGREVAGKTGTTDDNTDAWFVGYTPQLATAVWVGHAEGRVPLRDRDGRRIQGGTVPAQVWHDAMDAMLAGRATLPFHLDDRWTRTVAIDPVTGLLAAAWCPGEPQRLPRVLVPTVTCPRPATPTPTPSDLPSLPAPSSSAKPTVPTRTSPSPDATSAPDDGPSPSPDPLPSPTESASATG